MFENIEMFYNPQREHTHNGMLSPVDFETRQFNLNKAGVQETRGTSHAQTRHRPKVSGTGTLQQGRRVSSGLSHQKLFVLLPVMTILLKDWSPRQTRRGSSHETQDTLATPYLF